MTKADLGYEQPREKLQKKGVASLSDSELLQVIIGSGNAQASVSRIAKRSLRLLSLYGSSLTYEQLSSVAGLGPARSSQIIAAFELSARYPVSISKPSVNNSDEALRLMAELRVSKNNRMVAITVDGAKRLITKRSYRIQETTHPSALIRRLFVDIATDNASGVYVASGSSDYSLTPRMFDLSFARDLRAMAQLFLVTVHCYCLVNKDYEYVLKRESW